METKTLAKPTVESPSQLSRNGRIGKLFDVQLDANFNYHKVLNVPSVNVKETDHAYKLSVAVPGLEKDDFDIQLNQGILTISAEKEQKKDINGKFNRREYNYSSWARSFPLPEDAADSDISAEYKNGELRLDIPKNGNKKKHPGKQIKVD